MLYEHQASMPFTHSISSLPGLAAELEVPAATSSSPWCEHLRPWHLSEGLAQVSESLAAAMHYHVDTLINQCSKSRPLLGAPTNWDVRLWQG